MSSHNELYVLNLKYKPQNFKYKDLPQNLSTVKISKKNCLVMLDEDIF